MLFSFGLLMSQNTSATGMGSCTETGMEINSSLQIISFANLQIYSLSEEYCFPQLCFLPIQILSALQMQTTH